MPAFHFRLAPVLRLREQSRETQRLAFAAVEEERLRLLNEMQRIETRLATYMQAMTREEGRALTVVDLQLHGEFIQHLDRTLQLKRAVLRTVEEKREERRLALLEADKEVKSLEQLQMRLQERHQHEEATAAQQQMDEVGQRRYVEQQRATEGKREAGGGRCETKDAIRTTQHVSLLAGDAHVGLTDESDEGGKKGCMAARIAWRKTPENSRSPRGKRWHWTFPKCKNLLYFATFNFLTRSWGFDGWP